MILQELLRKLKDEWLLVKDDTVYEKGPNWLADWTTVITHSITLDKEYLIYIQFTVETVYGGGCGRVLWNEVPLVATGNIYTVSTPISKVAKVFIIASAGTHNFKFQLAGTSTGPDHKLRLTKIRIAILNFEDQGFDESFILTKTIGAGQTETVLDIPVTAVSRKTCLGPLKECIHVIQALPFDVTIGYDNAYSVMKNPGESDEADRINWRLFINDKEVGWDLRRNDYDPNRDNFDYGAGCLGETREALDAGKTASIKITAKNGFTYSRDVRAYCRIVNSPWLLGDEQYEPIDLNVPPGSTIHIKAEPLFTDPDKSIALGKVRFLSFGADYYESVSGTGMITFSYTFDVVPREEMLLVCKGWGGCISMITVDIRG